MTRGNSKLYRIRKENIKVIPLISRLYVEDAFRKGYMFVKRKDIDIVYMISTTCSMKSIMTERVNVDVITGEDTFTSQRI